MNHTVQASFIFCFLMDCTAKRIKHMHIFNRIIAKGIEMTIFRFDFQDYIVFLGIQQLANHFAASFVFLGIQQPAIRFVAYNWCRCCCWCHCCSWYCCSQSFTGRYPVIVLVAFTLLAHLSKRFWMSVAYAVHKTCYTDRRDLENRETGCALSRGIYRFALCSIIISFNR